ncbi:MAG: sugar ABC transporter ATP-binding protein [Desulfurococcaceae archaeon]
MSLVLEAKGIVKRFPGVVALKGVDFDLRAGEVHAIVGQNGAGKSTFVKILNGILQPDAGELRVYGKKVTFRGPLDAKRHGITLVHQEIMLIPHLSVAENVFLSRLPFEAGHRALDRRRIEQEVAKYLNEVGLNVDPWLKAKDLGVGEQELVQIARALMENAQVICLDEPTRALSAAEVRRLFEVVRRLKEAGRSIVYISHYIDEIFEIADRITVLRDGQKITTVETGKVTKEKVVELMLGRGLREYYVERTPSAGRGEPVLAVRGLSTRPLRARGIALRGVSFELRRGEVLGVTGLLGAGKSELGKALIGVEPVTSGEIIVMGARVRIRSPSDAAKHGIYYLPEDRLHEGLVGALSVKDNIVLPSVDRLSRALGFRVDAVERRIVKAWIERLNIVTPSMFTRVLNLSGGNQQKVVVAKLLNARPRVLIIDEPTVGIDVGAKGEIRRILKGMADEGIGVILLSSDVDEVLSLSDKVLVLHRGRQVALVPRAELDRDRLINLMAGK